MRSKICVKRIGIAFILLLSMVLSSACGTIFPNDDADLDVEKELPSVGSYDELLTILETLESQQVYLAQSFGRATLDMDEASKGEEAAPNDAGSDHSGTNVQVEGVDEADIIKTDGQYIYQVNDNRIVIMKAYPADQMDIVKVLTFDDMTFYPSEIYLDGNYLVVIGNNYNYIPMVMPEDSIKKDTYAESGDDEVPPPEEAPDKDEQTSGSGQSEGETAVDATPDDETGYRDYEEREYIYYETKESARVMIYDITDPANASLVRDVEIDGYYLSSRKIGSELYIVSNKYIYYWSEEPDENDLIPWYRDSVAGEEFVSVGYDSIRYFPDGQESSYLIVAGLDLDDIGQQVNVEAFLGSGQTIYASLENMYITVPKWEYDLLIRTYDIKAVDEDVSNEASEDGTASEGVSVTKVEAPDGTAADDATGEEAVPESEIMPENVVTTQIYRFSLKDGKAVFEARGEVPGVLLNQFSMDEDGDYFRIATTTGSMWWSGEATSKNNLYVLDNKLKTIGSIEDIAPGETIYSVRFIGDRGYMVTYRTMDPLFVIDLGNPRAPKILGQLKIPGYSSYLHPYDENLIIGFGMDSLEVEVKDENGEVVGTSAYQMGMKIAMFDVSDVNNPIEKFSVMIGDRGTYSELLYNHKALLFSKDKGLMAFPVTVMVAAEKWMDKDKKIPNYGEFSFQGMYVYQVDPEEGFTFKTRITHLTEEDTQYTDRYWYSYRNNITRGLYIDDVLYTISQSRVMAHSLLTYEKIGNIEIPYE